ncbi:hypothetical protein ACOSP7_013190 [Xanthoceras sorbifolium]
MVEGENFRKHLNDFNKVTDQLTSVNITFSDEVRALLILGQLLEIECWNCGKTRHYKYQCKSLKNDDGVKAEANVASISRTNDVLICSLESKEESWVEGLQSNCSCRRKIKFKLVAPETRPHE